MRRSRGSTGLWPSSRFKVQRSMTRFSDLKVQSDPRVDDKFTTSDIILQASYIFFEHPLLFSNIPFFRTSPVPFNLEGAPPLSCILPPQEEENRSACRSYIMVSADHQRSGFAEVQWASGPVQGSRFKVSGSQPSVVELGASPLNFEL